MLSLLWQLKISIWETGNWHLFLCYCRYFDKYFWSSPLPTIWSPNHWFWLVAVATERLNFLACNIYSSLAEYSLHSCTFRWALWPIGLWFQNLNLGKISTNPKCHLTISWATSCQYQCVCNISSQYSTQFKRKGHFHFFRIWSSAKPRPIKNDISQSLGLDLVNINVYAKVYQNIPLSSSDRAIFTFSEFGTRQSLDQW